jgi:hypothetical protein
MAVCAPAGAAETWQRLSVYNSGLVAYVPSPFTTNDLQVQTAAYDPMHYSGQWKQIFVAAHTYRFENRWSHQCLDTLGGLTAEVRTPVVQRPCDTTMSQKWVLTLDDTLPVWHITNFLSGTTSRSKTAPTRRARASSSRATTTTTPATWSRSGNAGWPRGSTPLGHRLA